METCLISGDGVFAGDAAEKLAAWTAPASGSFRVLAVVGGQSSGKSTLLNALGGTAFAEMDESTRSQTTLGVWAAAPRLLPGVLVLDIEGSDSRERDARDEDGGTAERRNCLLALAAADCVVVNLWTHDVGRNAAAGRTMLRAVIEAHVRYGAALEHWRWMVGL